jgi:hypothetical protein
MSFKGYLLALFLFLLLNNLWGQSIVLVPVAPNPSTFTFSSPSSAGSYPGNFSNATQSVKYTGSSQYTSTVSVSLSSGTIPDGIGIYITAATGSFWDWLFGRGIGTGEQQVSEYPVVLIESISTTSSITRKLTLSIRIDDFGLLHPGTNPITLTYTIAAQ